MADEDDDFHPGDGDSQTYTLKAGDIRKGGYIVIKGRPCKVVEVSISKTGKHGHDKCHFFAVDIFTSEKLEDIVPSSHDCDVPVVKVTAYDLIDILEDGSVTVMGDDGVVKTDVKLPTDEALLKAGIKEGRKMVVSVISAMGEYMITAVRDAAPN
ncbi:unnamed protein product [Thlaspi arvense]|uniref:Eukaryotic translation initiation factor 5A n=1 Tax=Thlaspi arvense TaxID=13288 RepID=A0AAU9SLT4_THLAR|nr:unnamed protein product [Thlaspi arvense]